MVFVKYSMCDAIYDGVHGVGKKGSGNCCKKSVLEQSTLQGSKLGQ